MKKIFTKFNTLTGIVLSFVISTVIIYAVSTIAKPHTFEAGTPISSSQVNENFDVLYSKVNELISKKPLFIYNKGAGSTNTLSFYQYCPTGYMAISGGCNCSYNNEQITISRPVGRGAGSETGWECRCSNRGQARTYVNCMQVD